MPKIKDDKPQEGVFPEELMPKVFAEMDRILDMRKPICNQCGKSIEIISEVHKRLYGKSGVCLSCQNAKK